MSWFTSRARGFHWNRQPAVENDDCAPTVDLEDANALGLTVPPTLLARADRDGLVYEKNGAKVVIADVRTSCDGPLEMGEDLMSFEIGETVMKRPMPH